MPANIGGVRPAQGDMLPVTLFSMGPMAGPSKASTDSSQTVSRRAAWRRWLPLGIIVLGVILVFAFDLDDLATFEHLKENHQRLAAFVADHYVQALVGYLLLYVLFVALSLPGAIWLTLAAGFLFGAVVGTILVVIAATTGATLLFLAAKTSL